MSRGWWCPRCKKVQEEAPPCSRCGREELYPRTVRTSPLSSRQRIILRTLEGGGVLEHSPGGEGKMFWVYRTDGKKHKAFGAAWDLIELGCVHPTTYRITAKGRVLLKGEGA